MKKRRKPIDPPEIIRLRLSTRSYNALRRANVTTIAQLKGMTHDDLLKIRCIGVTLAQQILEALDDH